MRADVRRHPPPRARRLGHVRRGRRRARHAPAQHHRPGRRPPADRATRTAACWSCFNGEIYNHEALHARAGGRGPPVPHPQRHRGPGPSLRGRRRADARSGCAACSPSPSGTGAAGGCCSPATTSARSRCSTPSRTGGSPSPPRSRRCWRDDPSLADALALRARPVPHAAVRPAAGHVLRAHPGAAAGALHGLGERAPPRIERYWDLSYGPKWTYSEAETLERIDELLAETVRLHLTSDVPVGAFLSGGLDSTLIAAYAAKVLGLRAPDVLDGHPVSRPERAARRGGRGAPLRHPPLRRGGDAQVGGADLPRLISALDEPADPLSICLLHLARMTAREVKVVLGGDGGDELFGGYDRYAADRWLDAYRAVPEVVRDLVASQVLQRLPDQFTFKSFTHKLRWVDLMARKTGGERYAESLQYFWFNEARRAELYTPGFRAQLAGRRPEACLLDLYAHRQRRRADGPDDVRGRRCRGCPGQSLMILDRATMAYSLESRSPFLDPRFAEFMARVPVALKIRGRRLRYLERRLGERYLPPEVLRRKKQGFASPLMYIMEEEVRTLAPRAAAAERAGARRLSRRRAGAAAGGRAPGPAPRPRQPDLAAAERRGLVPAVHRRAVRRPTWRPSWPRLAGRPSAAGGSAG